MCGNFENYLSCKATKKRANTSPKQISVVLAATEAVTPTTTKKETSNNTKIKYFIRGNNFYDT